MERCPGIRRATSDRLRQRLAQIASGCGSAGVLPSRRHASHRHAWARFHRTAHLRQAGLFVSRQYLSPEKGA